MNKIETPDKKYRSAEKIGKIFLWVFLAGMWIVVISQYSCLPEQIPTHFNAEGVPDAFGNRATIFILPIIGTVMPIWLSSLNAGIRFIGIPVNGDPQLMSSLMNTLSLIIAAISLFLSIRTMQIAVHREQKLGAWFLPVVISVVITPIIIFVVRSYRKSIQ